MSSHLGVEDGGVFKYVGECLFCSMRCWSAGWGLIKRHCRAYESFDIHLRVDMGSYDITYNDKYY